MSAPPTPQRSASESLTSRFKRNPIRGLTLGGGRPVSPSTTTSSTGRVTPTRSATRDSSTPPPTTRSRSSIIPSALQRRISSTIAPSSTKASSSKAPSSEAVNDLDIKSAPSTTEQGSIDAPKEDISADVSGHARALSGSTVESEPPMTPPPAPAAEPLPISKPEDLTSDSPHDGASIASSRSPSRLRRQVSNISRRSVSGSIRRLSLLGPASPPQAETASIHAQGEMQKSLSRSPSISSLRRHAASPEPIPTKTAESTSTPEPVSEPEAPKAVDSESEVGQPEVIPQVAQTEAPQIEAPQTKVPEPVVEEPEPEHQPEVRTEVQPAVVSTPQESTPASSVNAQSSNEPPASRPVEPHTPIKPSMSRNASTTSFGRSPTPDKPDTKRRSTFTKWARKSIDRRPSVSGSPGLVRSPSRGPVDDESDTESVKERERKWGTGLPVPDPPAPKKSEDNMKRRFSLGRRDSAKSPNDSPVESDKKSGWGKVIRAVTKAKKEKADSSASTPEASSLDVSTELAESRPSLMIPERLYNDQRPLSAIVESPVAPLNPHMLVRSQSPEQVFGAPVPVGAMDSPVVVKAETTSPELSPVMVTIDSDASGMDSAVENLQALDAVAAEVQPPVETIAEEPSQSVEVEQPQDSPAPAEETPVAVEEVSVPEIVAPEAEAPTIPVAETTTPTPAPAPANLMSPVSPNSPSSSPWDAGIEREIARARRPASPMAALRPPTAEAALLPASSESRGSILTNLRKLARPACDWAVSPAIQLAVTLSLVLPRRKRDVANPSNRKRGGWWPLRRGQRTEMRFNAIRGVSDETPIVSKTWAVPAAVRTTAKVVTAPASETDEEDLEDEAAPRRFEFSLSPSPEPDLECPR
ncbi:proteoglycan 4 [Rhizoctonia solani]|uniref:Proteoglycan 4 n=1 Tax=Rhizoctonia solani TaxID=456999 RepID=A0A8H8NSX0_9AGAM|nr:proteoglycan 4 [Rhizoctonia solani]QRW19309.1 proteoglycan 4 [Rhizoctonia solani]